MLLDIEDAIEEKTLGGESEDEPKGYVPVKGTENMVHLKLVNGRRFSETTGKEISKTYTQIFTYAEWQLFKEHHSRIGIQILGVLYDPFNEAEKYVVK